MFIVRDCEHVRAPLERCFQLSTHLKLVAEALEMEMVPRDGFKTEGLVQGGDRINWYGWKFGLPHIHVSHIAKFQPPAYFQDTMEQGRFRRFEHDHHFSTVGAHTLIVDSVRFSMPLGPAGRLVGKYIVMPHVRKLLRTRLMMLKRIAESEEWKDYLLAS
jgi:ligand-binding SRPBCC domain-containing protein